MNHLTQDSKDAPWNAKKYEYKCPECGSESIEIFDSGDNWEVYKCLDCGYKWGNEPDPDSMKGGPDYER